MSYDCTHALIFAPTAGKAQPSSMIGRLRRQLRPFEKFSSEFGSGGFVFVFEENIGMIPSLRANPVFPTQQVGASVF
jgi:hypothetical protein